jgi:small subunit ribosomal protein S6
MFLFDPAVGAEWSQVEAEVNRLMERCGGQVITWGKWDERRLAFPIKRRKRGLYVLAYFRAAPDKITDLERDAELSESILRLLVLRADHVAEEQMRQLVGRPEPQKEADQSGSPETPAATEPQHADRNDQAAAEPQAAEAASGNTDESGENPPETTEKAGGAES